MWDNFKSQIFEDEELLSEYGISNDAKLEDIKHVIGVLFEKKFLEELDHEMWYYKCEFCNHNIASISFAYKNAQII